MPSRPLGSDTITIRVPTLVHGSRGDMTYEYADGAVIRACNFQPFIPSEKFQEEFTNERETTRTFYRLYVPWTTETEQITDRYRILFEGVEYEVHALTGKWKHFSGKKNHIAIMLKERIG